MDICRLDIWSGPQRAIRCDVHQHQAGSHESRKACGTILNMGSAFFAVSVSFVLLSLLTIFLIFREVLPAMSQEDQNLLRNYWFTGFRQLRNRDRAIRNAWYEHVRLFPQSRKRVLFASFLIASVVSAMGYSLWTTFGLR